MTRRDAHLAYQMSERARLARLQKQRKADQRVTLYLFMPCAVAFGTYILLFLLS